MPNSQAEEQMALFFFRQLGLSAEKIPEPQTSKAPDFKVFDGQNTYLVELKTKHDNPEQMAERDQILRETGEHSSSQRISPQTAMESVIDDAVNQLINENFEGDFRLVWIHTEALEREHIKQVAFSSLYGSEQLIDWTQKNGGFQGYFFHNRSRFFKWQAALDGAIITSPEGGQLCLNPLSPRYEQLKNSKFTQLMKPGVVDPIASEAAGTAMILNCPVEQRIDNETKLKFLREKYSRTQLTDIPMNTIGVTIAVPNKP